MPSTQTAVASSLICNSVCHNAGETAVSFNCLCSICKQFLGEWHRYVRQIEHAPRKLPKISYMHMDCYDTQRVTTPLNCLDSNRRHCTYQLERLGLPDGRTLLIVSDTDSNPGMSVTNNVERAMAAAMDACRLLDAGRIVFVEHYPVRQGRRTPTYDLVTFGSISRFPAPPYTRLNNPAWQRMQGEDWERFGLPPR